MIKVSVIIPVYNLQEYISTCLNSIMNQSLKEIEIIVVDDGSTDNSLDIICDLALNDKRIKVIPTLNLGVSIARNKGLDIARGKYVYQIDGDDWLELNALEVLYSFAEKNDADIVITNAFLDYEDKQLVKPYIDGRNLSGNAIQDLLTGNIKPCIWTKFYKVDLFKSGQVRYLEGIRIGEDLLINFILFMQTDKIYKLEESFVHYVQRIGSTTNSYSDKFLDIFKVYDEMNNILKKKNMYLDYEEEFIFSEFLHTYFYRVVLANNLGDVHKKMYLGWNRCKDTVNINNNFYIKRHMQHESFKNRFLEFIYRKNYYSGVLCRMLINLIKKLVKSNFK